MRARPLFTLVVALLVSGCAAQSPADTDAGPDALAGPNVEAEGGILEGLVLDDELVPVANASVVLESDHGSATTGGDGTFRFVGLPTGELFFEVSKPGYAAQGVRAMIIADEAARVQVLLTRLASQGPYVETMVFTGLISVGTFMLDSTLVSVQIYETCPQCRFDFDGSADLESMQMEMLFTPSVASASGPLLLTWSIWNHSKASAAVMDPTGMYGGGYIGTGEKNVVNRTDQMAGYAKWTPAPERYSLLVSCDLDWICIEQKFDAYLSLAYREKIAADFTALPAS